MKSKRLHNWTKEDLVTELEKRNFQYGELSNKYKELDELKDTITILLKSWKEQHPKDFEVPLNFRLMNTKQEKEAPSVKECAKDLTNATEKIKNLDVNQDKSAPKRLVGLENDTHKKLMGLTQFNITDKCMFCLDNKSHQNPIIRFNVEDTLRLCPRCSKLYTNKDFLQLIEIICYSNKEDRFPVPDKKVKDRTQEEHLSLIKNKYGGSVRDYLLSMGEFKDVDIDDKVPDKNEVVGIVDNLNNERVATLTKKGCGKHFQEENSLLACGRMRRDGKRILCPECQEGLTSVTEDKNDGK